MEKPCRWGGVIGFRCESLKEMLLRVEHGALLEPGLQEYLRRVADFQSIVGAVCAAGGKVNFVSEPQVLAASVRIGFLCFYISVPILKAGDAARVEIGQAFIIRHCHGVLVLADGRDNLGAFFCFHHSHLPFFFAFVEMPLPYGMRHSVFLFFVTSGSTRCSGHPFRAHPLQVHPPRARSCRMCSRGSPRKCRSYPE